MATKETQTHTERPPVIAILGHVDHGKSTLLDTIRKANTVEGEAGGITQHVAAYEVEHTDTHGAMKRITFIDTPGHEAFGAIRSRSTTIADIAILIVSAEDGVKPQTKEAITLIKESKTPFVVAINKIDTNKADINRTISDLIENEVYLEGYGGDVPYTPISAKRGDGIDELLETLLLVAELEEFKADTQRIAEGFVIEAHRDPKKGISATVIIKNGHIKQSMYMVSGVARTPVRIMEDFAGKKLTEASVSSPITLVGWDALPIVGEEAQGATNKKEAEGLVALAEAKREEKEMVPEELAEGVGLVPLVIKADVAGSIEAIKHEIEKLKHDRVIIKLLHADVGAVSEADIKAAGADGTTVIVGFNTKLDPGVTELAERQGITIKTFDIIYKLTEWLEEELAKRVPKMTVAEVRGKAKILKTFSATKKSQVVGGRVEEGVVTVGDKVNVVRRDNEIGKGKIVGLQVQKQSSESISEGNEFGMQIESQYDIAPGDYIEAISLVEK